jgi:hypothetical protein
MLSLSVVLPSFGQQREKAQGLRPDAPKYALRGPHWVGYRAIVIGEGTEEQLDAGLWYPALNPDDVAEVINYEFTSQTPDLQSEKSLIVFGRAVAGAPLDTSMQPYPLVIF